jgi:aminoglycoside phosphotransferase (APT) family kinase protein
MGTFHPVAPDDIVLTYAEGEANERPPLLVLEPLERFLDEAGLGSGPIVATPLGEGHSNVTFGIHRGASRFVLRRPPRPPLPPSAHNVIRETEILEALHGQVPVPRILVKCVDEDVIGAPFYVMEMIDGLVVNTVLPRELHAPADLRRLGEDLIDGLIDLHSVDWKARGLGGFGKPTGYLERQMRRFKSLWEHNRTRDLPAVERIATWLSDNMPESGPATIVHGDYRLGNVMFTTRLPPRLISILDWEMSAIGDPLADLGYLCWMWVDRDDVGTPHEELTLTRSEGFSSRSELVARYGERSGRSVEALRWYEVLAAWKSIVFVEGNYKRAAAGSSDDPYLRSSREAPPRLAAFAEQLAFGERATR